MLTGLWNLPDIQNSRQNRSKNKQVRENAMTQAQGTCSLRIMGSCMVATVWYFASTSDAILLQFRCALISVYPSHNDGQCENRSKRHVQPFDRYCDARKKLVDRQPKLFKLTIVKTEFFMKPLQR